MVIVKHEKWKCKKCDVTYYYKTLKCIHCGGKLIDVSTHVLKREKRKKIDFSKYESG